MIAEKLKMTEIFGGMAPDFMLEDLCPQPCLSTVAGPYNSSNLGILFFSNKKWECLLD